MRFLSSGVFWGAMIILFGFGILLKAIFHINIPFFKILLGIIIICFGISIILEGLSIKKNTSFFGTYNFNSELVQNEYNIIFSTRGNIDFSNINFSNYNGKEIKINSIFASTLVYIDKDMEVNIKASSAFGLVSMPNGDSVTFGNIERVFGSNASKRINLNVNLAFGEVKIMYK